MGPVVATPVIAPGTGSYTSSQQVTLTDTTPGATIYYINDGTPHSTGSTKYIGAITVNSNETLSAIVTAAGYTQSATVSATYTFHEGIATVTGVLASMNFPGDITQAVGNSAWFGFTAGTGAHSASQRILSWSYSEGADCSAK